MTADKSVRINKLDGVMPRAKLKRHLGWRLLFLSPGSFENTCAHVHRSMDYLVKICLLQEYPVGLMGE